MPLYEYACDACGGRFERIQKFSDPPMATCPTCGGPVRKLISSPAIQFKGSGWYITDYAKPTAGKAAADGASASSESSAKADAGSKGEKASDSASKGDAGSKSSRATAAGESAKPATTVKD